MSDFVEEQLSRGLRVKASPHTQDISADVDALSDVAEEFVRNYLGHEPSPKDFKKLLTLLTETDNKDTNGRDEQVAKSALLRAVRLLVYAYQQNTPPPTMDANVYAKLHQQHQLNIEHFISIIQPTLA